MKWITSGQIAALVTITALLVSPSWITLGAWSMSVLLVGLETYLVARAPQLPSHDVQKQISDLKDTLGNVQLAMSMQNRSF